MIPFASTATVYRGGRRRYLTLGAACRAEARARINERCECERGPHENGYSPEVCEYHADSERHDRIVARLARWYQRAAEAAV